MQIRFKRLSDARHTLTIERADGSRAACELETRSVLLHDLVHYAVEAEAGLTEGFWGLLAAGVGFDELLAEAAAPTRASIMQVESLVGPMQAVWHGRLDRDRYVTLASSSAPFVDRAFVDRVCARIRRLWGHWRGTPFHEVMELSWPAPD